MSKHLTNDVHHLLFANYHFPLSDREFLDRIALHVYDGAGKGMRVIDSLHETLRILSGYDGFHAQYVLTSQRSDPTKHAWLQVNEHISLHGQDDLPFAVFDVKNGERAKEGTYITNPARLIEAFERLFEHEKGHDWWLGEGRVFQLSSIVHEWRRIIFDMPTGFGGLVWKNSNGSVHMYITQVGEVEFADERLNLKLSIVPPTVFNGAVVEHEKSSEKQSSENQAKQVVPHP